MILMLILFGLAAITYIVWLKVKNNSDFDGFGFVAGFFITVLFIVGGVLIGNHLTFGRDLADYYSLQDTLNTARLNGNSLELATIQKDVLEYNRSLATRKWWARGLFVNWFYPSGWLKLAPIK